MGEKEQLLRDIGIADFVLTELILYLDTHPFDPDKTLREIFKSLYGVTI